MKSGISLLLAVFISFFSFTGNAQTTINPKKSFESYWKKIDSLEIAGLPRTALTEVEQVYELAKAEKNTGQLLKSIIFKLKFSYAFEADNYAQQIVRLEDDLKKMSFPDSALAHSILGEMYWNYFTQNRYRFYNRTKTTDFIPTDLQTWSLAQIFEKSREHYLNSIQPKDLLFKIDAGSLLPEIIQKGYPENFQYKTLYDFLAFRVVDFLRTDEVHLEKFTPSFRMDEERFFASSADFLKMNLNESKSPSNTILVLRIFQDLLKMHQHEKIKKEFLLTDLHRIIFVFQKSTHPEKDELYIKALENLLADCTDYTNVESEVQFRLAMAIYTRGNKYEKNTGEKYRMDFKTAKEICTQILEKSSQTDSFTLENCRALISTITEKNIAVTTEEVLIPREASPALVSFRNIDSVYVRIIKTSYLEYDSLQQRIFRNVNQNGVHNFTMMMADTLRQFTPIKSLSYQLPEITDYRNHSTEIILPGLPAGQYVFLFSVDSSFSYSENAVAYDFKSVSNISFINRPNKKGDREYILLHRQTGKPLSGIEVKSSFVKYNYRERKTIIVETQSLKTDNEGYVKISPKEKNTTLIVEFKNGDDVLSTKNYDNPFDRGQYINKNREQKQWEPQTVLFIDRGIYRPGQTLHFKGIVYKTDFEKKHEIVTGYSTTVTLYDVNSQKVSELQVTTNEFGTFSGSFVLPQGGLNGQMSIREQYGQKYFSVEEYKRPTFEVEFDKTKGTPKIGEEVLVSGIALAFSGAPIDGAIVKYTVERNSMFPKWYSRPQQYAPRPVTNGETTTNSKGEFDFTFKAVTDNLDDPLQNPIYNFTITADITDINGETHSATKTVAIGYAALVLQAGFPELADKNKLDSVSISTTNMEGNFEPAKGIISISKLEAPKQTYRDRYWEMPDTFIYSEKQFHSKLPQNLYRDENNFITWEKEKVVLQSNFDTGNSKYIQLPKSKKWNSGKYKTELVSTDKYGTEVKATSYFTLFADTDKTIPFAKTDFFHLAKTEAKPGDTIEILAGTSENEITVIYELEQNGKLLKKENLTIKNRLQKILIPVTDEFSGNINLNYVFVKNGRIYNHSEVIQVPYSQKQIAIKFETFRDKLNPGEEEQWRIKLAGNDGEKLAAEMVATMYDASLDQFNVNTFNFNVNRFWWPELRWDSQHCFAPSFKPVIEQNWNNITLVKEIQINNIQWFGFHYYYQPQFSEKELKVINEGSVVILSSKKSDKVSVSGTVKNDKNEVIPGAEVSIKETGKTVVTDENGKFELKYENQKATVTVSFPGYKTLEFDVAGTVVADIKLANENAAFEEVVNIGNGKYRKSSVSMVSESMNETIMIRGTSSLNNQVDLQMDEEEETEGQMFYIIDDKNAPQPASPESLATISARKNLNETAFFYPHLRTNKEGEIIINFTVPEALTKWKMLGFAHTKELKTGLTEKTLVTSKDLMVVPNLPRFLREGDKMILTSKIVNLSDKALEGQAQLLMFDALTMKPVDAVFKNSASQKTFLVDAGQSTVVNWEIEVPVGMQAVACRVVAQSGNFTDGEEKVVPVLSNRLLVTETLPVWVRQGQTKTFTLDKLVHTTSETRTNHSLTLEFTANPVWYAIQALPYLMEFPNECMEQTFSRFYANAIATSLINSDPKIKRVFDAWKMENNGEAFLSKLEQNQELKSMLIEETPWVLDAKNETERNKRIALLFDLNKMKNEQDKAIEKLKQGQYPSGGWPWFEGGKENRYITQHIVSGLGHLRKLKILDTEKDPEVGQMIEKAIRFLDSEILNEFKQIKATVKKEELSKNHFSNLAVHYLYGRSFFKDIQLSEEVAEAIHYFKEQAGTFWLKQNNYIKGLTALVLFRDGQKEIPQKIVKSLREYATHSDELGMYWKTPWGFYWNEAPVETQSLMIELFDEVAQDQNTVDELRIWLLKNKQTNNWNSTKATAEACYALLLGGTNWLATESKVQFEVGGKKFEPENDESLDMQAGSGYFKKVWNENEISPEMGKITVSKPDPGISWGGLYWQYFEQLDKITSAETPLSTEKKLFREVQISGVKTMEPIDDLHKISVGDKVIVRIILRTDRDMEFVHLKDMRASCFEPVQVLSGYQYQDGLGYYQTTKDASMNFFMDFLPKGSYVLEYPLWVSHSGNFSNGITTVQSMYAPEFSSHTEGIRVEVKER
jgi:hypothetical protein